MKNYSLNLFLALILFASGLVLADLSPAKAQSRGDRESLAQQAVIVWNTGNAAIADQIFSSDYKFHLIDRSDRDFIGRKEILDFISFLRKAYPDMKIEVDNLNVDGDTVIARVTFTGTNMGPRGDLPPTNKKVTLNSVWFFKIKDGVIIEQSDYTNMAAVFDQLGFTLVPPDSK